MCNLVCVCVLSCSLKEFLGFQVCFVLLRSHSSACANFNSVDSSSGHFWLKQFVGSQSDHFVVSRCSCLIRTSLHRHRRAVSGTRRSCVGVSTAGIAASPPCGCSHPRWRTASLTTAANHPVTYGRRTMQCIVGRPRMLQGVRGSGNKSTRSGKAPFA